MANLQRDSKNVTQTLEFWLGELFTGHKIFPIGTGNATKDRRNIQHSAFRT